LHDIEEIFGPDGPLSRSLVGFKPRQAQRAMAERVAAALAERRSLVVEAGTGTGKTFAYLVPALLSGRRVLVSTGTRTLQDQLYAKDLPLVARAIGAPARVALLKGRANYLCRYRFAGVGVQLTLDGIGKRDPVLAELDQWSRRTRTGDLAEVAALTDSHPLWPRITSTRENCLGMRCAEYAKCHVVEARKRANEADVVIVNHHLLLADLALKEDGFGDILGSADAVIVDEAHQVPDLATQFFGTTVTARQIESLVRDTRAELGRAALPAGVAASELRGVEADAQALQSAVLADSRGGAAAAGAPLAEALSALIAAMRGLADELTRVCRDAGVLQCAARASQLAADLARIEASGELEGARTAEATARGFTLRLIPFDIAERFQGLTHGHRAAWVFTSATLSVGEDFSHFVGRLGLADAETLQIASPFDYESQVVLYLPPNMPEPASPEYTAAVVRVAWPLIAAARGGAFVLFTSHKALAKAAQLVRPLIESAGGQLFVQGEAPREQLLHAFRAASVGVLLGTASFWEGVDVKGDALRLVVIEKLPFASPDDALTKARIDMLKKHGRNAFREYQLPEAALALKQGFGRLIRSETDRGVVAICDPRLIDKPYGRVFRAALPPMRVTRERGDAIQFLQRIAVDAAPAAAFAASQPAGANS
jgi:ATP-dependent DNA helicase DinG